MFRCAALELSVVLEGLSGDALCSHRGCPGVAVHSWLQGVRKPSASLGLIQFLWSL